MKTQSSKNKLLQDSLVKNVSTRPENRIEGFRAKSGGDPLERQFLEILAKTVPETASPRFVSFKGLSMILGRSESSLRYHFKEGRFSAAAKFGRVYSFDPDKVLKQLHPANRKR